MTDLPFLDKALHTHEEVIKRAREIGKARGLAKVVVAAAEEDDVLAALYACKQEGISDAILVGNEAKIKEALKVAEVPEDIFEIVHVDSDEDAAINAANIAARGDADVVMKGYIKTGTLLKILLKSDYGLRDRELVSHSAVLYVPKYGKVLNVTDGGTLIKPSLEQKLTVLGNGVQVLRAIGIQKPKVAVFGPGEDFDDTPEAAEARELVKVASEHWSEYCEIDGPMTLEDATAGTNGNVAGQADMLLVNSIEEGNITAKTLIQFGGAIFMGVIGGAKVPISLVSRSDSMMNKKASVALAVCVADYTRRGFETLPVIPLNEGDK